MACSILSFLEFPQDFVTRFLHMIEVSNTCFMVVVPFTFFFECISAEIIWYSYTNLLQSSEFSTILECKDRHFFHVCIDDKMVVLQLMMVMVMVMT